MPIAAMLDLRAGRRRATAHGLGGSALRCRRRSRRRPLPGSGGAVRALRVRIGDDVLGPARNHRTATRVLMSVGFAPAAGCWRRPGATLQYDAALQQHLPVKLPPGMFAAGRVNGVYDYAARRQDGRDAGAEAAAHARGGHAGRARLRRPESIAPGVASVSRCSRTRARRDFVDLDEDIQVKDLLEQRAGRLRQHRSS